MDLFDFKDVYERKSKKKLDIGDDLTFDVDQYG
jgi:hypothetical protein